MSIAKSETYSKLTDESCRDLDATFESIGNGTGYRLGVAGVRFTVRRFRRERGELHAELSVECSLPGIKTVDGVLSEGSFNLSSIRAREERAEHLDKRATGSKCNWESCLEELCQRVQKAERRGDPAIALADLPLKPITQRLFEVSGLQFARNHPTILFADGGSGKSYVGLYVAGVLAREIGNGGRRVLLADWEMDGEDHRERFERLFGADMPRNVFYIRCERPLSVEVDRLVECVREDAIDYIICDSIAAGCDGPPEAAEVATRYSQALRQIGIGSLLIAHTNRGKNSKDKPFGSVFWHNLARVTCHLSPTHGSPLVVTATQQKNNFGPKLDPVRLEIDFSGDRTLVRQVATAVAKDASSEPAESPKDLRTFILDRLATHGPLTQLELWHAWNDGEGKRASGPMRTLLSDLCDRGLLTRDRSSRKYSFPPVAMPMAA